ncbi:transporter substrate-binding domain-containing protein [Pseudoalteromonas sp. BDTF-M6]|uniref:substrate-binding periplasmic protein n=1 Tax=Pseudoalteromonas sp. BDTF-M6 TaxID=2796132 RepID=UPI001BB01A28|nr:transporter substrate-binding domain-containing protein [Pseudoalteromonas sp. BDTF-M6]MBS3798571.1 transporter substrate-binding domain-containing protein [Pseudoalteromonas sp. BDTF-M6]
MFSVPGQGIVLLLCTVIGFAAGWPTNSKAAETAKQATLEYQLDNQDYRYLGTWQGAILTFDGRRESKVVIATLDWPPYIGRQECQGGWLLQYMAAVMIEAGYNPEFRFLPWARAVRMAELGHVDILAPEYEIEASAPSDVVLGNTRLQHLALSAPYAHTPVHYISAADSELTQAPAPQSLSNYAVGVVRGYQNAPEVDKVLDSGRVIVQQAIDDSQNLQLLLSGRVNLIVAEPLVINTLAERQNVASDGYRVLQPAITEQPLYFALSTARPQWQQLMADINQAIRQVHTHALRTQIMHRLAQRCPASMLNE